jgi:deoxyguanosine kinase
VVLDEADNPFLADFYQPAGRAPPFSRSCSTRSRGTASRRAAAGRSVRAGHGLQTTCSTATRSYAYLNLDDNELFIYQRLYDLLAGRPAPDLVIYLQAPTDVLRRGCGSARAAIEEYTPPADEYLRS